MELLLQASSNNLSLVNEANLKPSAVQNKVSVSLEENEKRPIFSGKNDFINILFTLLIILPSVYKKPGYMMKPDFVIIHKCGKTSFE